MNVEHQHRVELRAYAIWQEEGQPQGRHEVHWLLAERELAAEASPVRPRRRRPVAKPVVTAVATRSRRVHAAAVGAA